MLLTVSPFYHFNRADYLGGPNDPSLSTLDKLDTQYGGAQVTLSSVSKRHNARVPQHTTFDLSLGNSFGESWSFAVQALNLANRRFLLDNSLTFGGTHYFDPRQIYGEIRYRFHF